MAQSFRIGQPAARPATDASGDLRTASGPDFIDSRWQRFRNQGAAAIRNGDWHVFAAWADAVRRWRSSRSRRHKIAQDETFDFEDMVRERVDRVVVLLRQQGVDDGAMIGDGDIPPAFAGPGALEDGDLAP